MARGRLPDHKIRRGTSPEYKGGNAVCQRTGHTVPRDELRKEWNGSWVHYTKYERKHPALFVLEVKEDTSVHPALPTPAEPTTNKTVDPNIVAGSLPSTGFGNDDLT